MCTLYIDIAYVHCIVTLYASKVALCMLYNFSQIDDTVLTLYSDTVYGEHRQCGTVSAVYNCIVYNAYSNMCTLYNSTVYIYSDTAYICISTVYKVFYQHCNARSPALMVCG